MRRRSFGLLAVLACLAGDMTALAEVDGRAIYNFRCYFCHGYAGDAETLAARMLEPRPRDFTRTDPSRLSAASMRRTVKDGRPGTAMQPFGNTLTDAEIDAVVGFVRETFMQSGASNTRYHTAANGWPGHERFAAAFPFARGEIALDVEEQALSAEQQAGRRLFLESCITCHDTGAYAGHRAEWRTEAVSYPRTGFATGDFLDPPDAVSGATTFARHDIKPPLPAGADDELRLGETLFQDNCAFCHAADGTGRNWIGTFMQPHPRDLTAPPAMRDMTAERLASVIRNGLPGTSMPAWRHVLDDNQVQALVRYIGTQFHPLTVR